MHQSLDIWRFICFSCQYQGPQLLITALSFGKLLLLGPNDSILLEPPTRHMIQVRAMVSHAPFHIDCGREISCDPSLTNESTSLGIFQSH